MSWLWIGVGGFLGANARYLLTNQVRDRIGGAFPWGTLLVNLTGSLAIGFVMALLTERYIDDPVWRTLVVVGFLGGYTTFSSFAFESITLMEQGDWAKALMYIGGTNLLGLFACYGGMSLARSLV